MSKLVILNLGKGNLQDGFPQITVQLQNHNIRQFQGALPSAPKIVDLYRRWQLLYDLIYEARSINIGGLRNSQFPDDITIDDTDITHVSDAEFYQLCDDLQNEIDTWLDNQGFRNIDRQLRMQLTPNDEIRFIIQTEDLLTRKLPWHVWHFFNDYPQAEVALSPIEFGANVPKNNTLQTVRILAILGDSRGINIEADRKLLSSLPGAEIVFLVEPKRQELDEALWDNRGWNILFFAGHSSSQTSGDSGHIYINNNDKLTIHQLKNALRKAIKNGLQLAIFNSCDGLGLAGQLDNLFIPQIIVMRAPVPDRVAQEFLKRFLSAFASGKSFYTAQREAREQLQGLESEFPAASWLPVICQNPAVTPLTWFEMANLSSVNHSSREQNRFIQRQTKSVKTKKEHDFIFIHTALISIAVTILISTARHWGIFQPLELRALDQIVRMRGLDEKADDRLLLITITEGDLKYQDEQGMQRRDSLSDAALIKILTKIEKFKPKVVGLNVYRDFIQPEEKNTLTQKLQENKNFFAICKHNELEINYPGSSFIKELPAKRLGFSDFVKDDDGILRRQLLSMSPNRDSPCPTDVAFAWQLALSYLNITPNLTGDGNFQLGKVIFPTLTKHWGGYQGLDAAGYQTMLNYRRTSTLAKTITLKEVLQGKLNANLIKDRIVIIGTVAPTLAKDFYTPYSLNQQQGQSKEQIFIQAEMTSQIISAVLDGRPLINVWSGKLETLWIWFSSIIGSSIALFSKNTLARIGATIAAICTTYIICFAVFATQSTWIPLLPPVLSTIVTLGAVIACKNYKFK
jgi:CHASE2 domain-containing sensor protein